jgi:hypothetical protein
VDTYIILFSVVIGCCFTLVLIAEDQLLEFIPKQLNKIELKYPAIGKIRHAVECPLCLSGQIALWYSVIMWLPVATILFNTGAAILIAGFINKFWEW